MTGFKAYDQNNKNVAAANMLLAENVEALSDGDSWYESAWNSIKDAANSIKDSAKEWYDSKVYDARLMTVTTQNGGNASVGAPVYGIGVGVGGSTSTTVSYQCNCCVNGHTFAHCSEISNQCNSQICNM